MQAIDNAKTVSGLKEYMHGGEIFQRWILLLIYYDWSQWSPTPRKVVPDFCQLPSNRSACGRDREREEYERPGHVIYLAE